MEEVPEGIAALTGLTYLGLGANNLRGGWEHLRPLARLRELHLAGTPPAGVPRDLTVLRALEVLDLAYTSPRRGWRHLRALPRLRRLSARRPHVEIDEAFSLLAGSYYLSSDSNAEA